MSDNITITGNVATIPECKHTAAGVPITTFRVASSQRRFDRATESWIDGHTNWYSISTFRGLAEHAFASLRKGDRVVLTGRLRVRRWESGDRQGTSVDVDADAIGHDLLWGTTTFTRAAGSPRETESTPEETVSSGAAWRAAGDDVAEGTSPAEAWSAPLVAPDDARELVDSESPF